MNSWNKDVFIAENKMLVERQNAELAELRKENEQLKKDVELWEDTHKHHLNIYHNLYDDYCKLKEELKDIKLGKPVPAGITILKKMELSKSFEKQLRHEICEKIRECSYTLYKKGTKIPAEYHIVAEELEEIERGDE